MIYDRHKKFGSGTHRYVSVALPFGQVILTIFRAQLKSPQAMHK